MLLHTTPDTTAQHKRYISVSPEDLHVSATLEVCIFYARPGKSVPNRPNCLK